MIKNLTELKLEIEPDKCQLMIIDFKKDTSKLDPMIKIYGQTIGKTKTMNILGIPIADRLELDTKNNKFGSNLTNKIQFLNLIKRFNIINENQDWQTLLGCYIGSIIIENNIPILAIDPKAIEWADRIRDRALRLIFDWPNNSSLKAMRLVTNWYNARSYTTAAITKLKYRTEFRYCYELLAKIVKIGGLKELKSSARLSRSIPNHISTISLSNQEGRIFREPRLDWKLRETYDLEYLYRRGPIRLAHSTRNTASLFLLMNNIIIQEWKGKHTSYPIGHFNLMGLLYYVTNNNNIPSRTVVFSKASSVYLVLTNPSNHDWRTNLLKKEMHEISD